jgi:hypothetical protein
MCLFNLRQESWREPIAEVSERVAVELQPYGSKNLDGYRRGVVPPMYKTWDCGDVNV